jgi:hypothetical protein
VSTESWTKGEIWLGIGIKTTQFETLYRGMKMSSGRENCSLSTLRAEKCCFVETWEKSSKVRLLLHHQEMVERPTNMPAVQYHVRGLCINHPGNGSRDFDSHSGHLDLLPFATVTFFSFAQNFHIHLREARFERILVQH